MNRTEHLLTCLAEECAEVAQRVSKALRFGLSEIQPGQDRDNAQRIVDELCDLVAVADILQRERVLPKRGLDGKVGDPINAFYKSEKIERYMQIGRVTGALTDALTPS